ncbi:MAG: glycosyltransferase family 2 protein [Chitinophagaceae bacterium]
MLLSVVIITKNEAHIIGTTLQSLQGLTDDIVMVDSGSTDDTISIGKQFNARVIEMGWNGYGINKNVGIDAAQHDWILNIDADEALDEELKQALLQLSLTDDRVLYEMRFKNFFCGKWIRFGEWGFDKHIRLFNRKQVRWNTAAVHESLQLPSDARVQLMPGHILHYTTQHQEEYAFKTLAYAKLNAEKYFQQGKKAPLFKQIFSPLFSFIKYYILKAGFLDGQYGWIIALSTAKYTYLKYSFLRKMYRQQA